MFPFLGYDTAVVDWFADVSMNCLLHHGAVTQEWKQY
jgi:hypothetical protein